jgi:hypothetical protein
MTMAVNKPSAAALQPPPDLPSMPDVSPTLSNYLRTFALWCRNGFADRMPAHQALPFVMLMADDAAAGTTPKVFMIRVNSAGAISATQMTIGSGSP